MGLKLKNSAKQRKPLKNEFDENVTVIKTSYSINGEEGTIAIIGPKRMEYDKVVALLNYLKGYLER